MPGPAAFLVASLLGSLHLCIWPSSPTAFMAVVMGGVEECPYQAGVDFSGGVLAWCAQSSRFKPTTENKHAIISWFSYAKASTFVLYSILQVTVTIASNYTTGGLHASLSFYCLSVFLEEILNLALF